MDILQYMFYHINIFLMLIIFLIVKTYKKLDFRNIKIAAIKTLQRNKSGFLARMQTNRTKQCIIFTFKFVQQMLRSLHTYTNKYALALIHIINLIQVLMTFILEQYKFVWKYAADFLCLYALHSNIFLANNPRGI